MQKILPKTRDQNLEDALTAVTQLDFRQLVVFQASLAEHILNCVNYSEQQRSLRSSDTDDQPLRKETEH
jgi:hypothetical protein